MSLDRDTYFARVKGRVDLALFQDKFVVVVGVGSVGSEIALALSNSGVGRFVLVDGNPLAEHNLPRHALEEAFIGANKAQGLASVLNRIPGVEGGAVPAHLDERFSDLQVDQLLAPADLIIVATDDRRAQRRVGARALALDIPAIFPGLYEDGGGEIFVQLDPEHACFLCWDQFRSEQNALRGVSALATDAFAVIQQSLWLCEALLDRSSPRLRALAPAPGQTALRQLLVLRGNGAPVHVHVRRHPGCPSCAVGESQLGSRAPRPDGVAGLVKGLLQGHERIAAAGWEIVLTGELTPPEIELFEVQDPVAVEGTVVTVRWRASNATAVELSWCGRRPAMGEERLLLTRTRRISATAINPFARSATVDVVVRCVTLPKLTEIPVFTMTGGLSAPPGASPPPVSAIPHGAPSRVGGPTIGAWPLASMLPPGPQLAPSAHQGLAASLRQGGLRRAAADAPRGPFPWPEERQ